MLAVAIAQRLDARIAGLTYALAGQVGGNITVDWMPDTPNNAVAVMTDAGTAQLSKLPVDTPGAQILVRGEERSTVETYELAAAIYAEMQCLDAVTIGSGPHAIYVIGCSCLQSGPIPIGRDEKNRPEYSLNFQLRVHNPTTHRPAVAA